MIPVKKMGSNIGNGFLFRVPEYMIYDEQTRLRKPVNNEMFLMTSTKKDQRTKISLENDLYLLPSQMQNEDHCVYLHQWIG